MIGECYCDFEIYLKKVWVLIKVVVLRGIMFMYDKKKIDYKIFILKINMLKLSWFLNFLFKIMFLKKLF